MVEAISKRGDGSESSRDEKSRIVEAMKSNRFCSASTEKAGDDEKAEAQPLHVHGQAAQPVAEKNTEGQ